MESVISKTRECWVCGRRNNLHCHHCWGGYSRRKNSERRGFKVYLCPQHHYECHQHSNTGIALKLKRICQGYYETHYGSRQDFIREFGRSVL